jgi:proliferating cell nuclear antigen
MLEAKLAKAHVIKKIIEAVRELCKEVNLECTDKGITMQAMDSSHVSLVNLTMKETIFQSYRADREKVLGVSMESLAKIFKLCGNDDVVTMKADDDADSLQFIFENEKEDRISDFSLKLLDIEAENLGIPEDQDYKAVVKMPSAELMKICRDLKEFGESINVHCTKDGLKWTVKGDIGLGNVVVKPRDGGDKPAETVTIACTEPVQAAFALRYLNLFAKATPLSETVTMQISDEQPLTLEYNLEKEESGCLRFYLAPKVDEDAA